METFEITLRSTGPIDFGDLEAAGFEKLLRASGLEGPLTWTQDGDGCTTVTFRHEAADADRAYGATERIASDLGIGVWIVTVTPA